MGTPSPHFDLVPRWNLYGQRATHLEIVQPTLVTDEQTTAYYVQCWSSRKSRILAVHFFFIAMPLGTWARRKWSAECATNRNAGTFGGQYRTRLRPFVAPGVKNDVGLGAGAGLAVIIRS